MIHDLSKLYGDREALRYKPFKKAWQSISWNTFSKKIWEVSDALLQFGVKRQENIAIFSQNCAEHLFVDFGAWGVGAVTIPFYATSSEQQIQFMLNDANVHILFVGEQEQYDKARRMFALCHSLERIIVFDKSVCINEHDYCTIFFDDFLKFSEGISHKLEIEKRHREASFDDLANILYTSGTTGDSKGVMLSHFQYHAALQANSHCVPITYNDRVLNFLPYAHIFEKGWTLLCLSMGASLIINTYPQEVQQTMKETHPTSMCSVPRFWEKVYSEVMNRIEKSNVIERKVFMYALDVGKKYNIDFVLRGKQPPFALKMEYEAINRTVFSMVRNELGLVKPNIFPVAGSAIATEVEIFVRSIGLKMIAGYGLTESLATVTCNHIDRPISVGSVGYPIEGLSLKLSEEGEILLKGPTITRGYYNREDLTKAAFTSDGYFKTGDTGEIIGSELFLRERIKDLFKTSNGKYIAPQMIESKLLVDKFIDQIAIVADKKKFVSALIVPEFNLIEEYARSHGIGFTSKEELCLNPEICSMMMERINTIQQQLARYEQIKRITLLSRPFSMDKGELTDTLKLRRRVIDENYREQINEMYKE